VCRYRTESAEASAEALRARLERKTEDAAATALRAKRHELRAQEESVERRRATQRSEESAAVGAAQVTFSWTHSLKAPGFNP
jgi:hypothetical protein